LDDETGPFETEGTELSVVAVVEANPNPNPNTNDMELVPEAGELSVVAAVEANLNTNTNGMEVVPEAGELSVAAVDANPNTTLELPNAGEANPNDVVPPAAAAAGDANQNFDLV
jgi:hypothetical protein